MGVREFLTNFAAGNRTSLRKRKTKDEKRKTKNERRKTKNENEN